MPFICFRSQVRAGPGAFASEPILFFSQDRALPHCAMPEYIRSLADLVKSKSHNKVHDPGKRRSGSNLLLVENTGEPVLATTRVQADSHIHDSDTPTPTRASPDLGSIALASSSSSSASTAAVASNHAPRRVCYAEAERELCTVEYEVCPCVQPDVLTNGVHFASPPTGSGLHGTLYCPNLPYASSVVSDDDDDAGPVVDIAGCVSLMAESNGYSL